ncbi:MAG: hypothetical protein AABY93_12875 [Bacteroidota bacterium]
MKAKQATKLVGMGFLTWLIPFAVSFLFYKPGGELTIPYDLFKSIMMVTASGTGCYFLFRYFTFIDVGFIIHGVIVGLSWFLINIILDTIVLLPIMKVSFHEYFISIGLRYTIIPALSISMGYLLKNKVKQ